MNNEQKPTESEVVAVTDITTIGFTKNEMMDVLKIFIPSVTALLIAFGAYKYNYSASGKFLGFEFNLNSQNS